MEIRHELQSKRLFPAKICNSYLNGIYRPPIDFTSSLHQPKERLRRKIGSRREINEILLIPKVEDIRIETISTHFTSPQIDRHSATSSESENDELIVKKLTSSESSPIKIESSIELSTRTIKNRESRIPVRTIMSCEMRRDETVGICDEIDCVDVGETIVEPVDKNSKQKPSAEMKAKLNTFNEFIPIETKPIDASGDESDVVVKLFKPHRRRAFSLGNRNQVSVHVKQLINSINNSLRLFRSHTGK